MSTISERLNSPKANELFRAFSFLYSRSKMLSTIQTFFALLAAAIGAVCSIWFQPYQAWGGLLVLVVLLLDLVVWERQKQRYQTIGAKIHELFDVYVLDLPSNELRMQSTPLPELLHRYATKYGDPEKATSIVRSWYPEAASKVSVDLGRLICQRSCMQWDTTLRIRLAICFFCVAICLVIAAIAYGILSQWNVEQLLLMALLPIFPSCQKLVREGWKHLDLASDSSVCLNSIGEIWKRIFGEPKSTTTTYAREFSRRIQDELFDRRRSVANVPNWFYSYFREKLESEMKYAAEVMISDAIGREAKRKT